MIEQVAKIQAKEIINKGNVILTVKVKGMKHALNKIKLGLLFIKIGCWIGNIGCILETLETDDAND